ncbi:MAG TPA: nucleoside deaminase [Cyclobacteriaceae bacterium]|jgi:tRNA(Arg) A34 adenosine deaminase TadA|nr:nucleoside deaminase [Cyclobacteriaceae bacterium]
MKESEKKFMLEAIQLSKENMQAGKGGPFGCVVVKDGEIIGRGFNQVTSTNDPTAHAEVIAIREACKSLGTFQLTGCEIYTSCEPCPMCLGAIYWARPSKVYYANTRDDAASIQFDDDFIYKEIGHPISDRSIPFVHMKMKEALDVFEQWKNKADKIDY